MLVNSDCTIFNLLIVVILQPCVLFIGKFSPMNCTIFPFP